MLPNLSFEDALWNQGYTCVAGIDEVGRGCFAGPIVAAACVFDKYHVLKYVGADGSLRFDTFHINDSKKLPSKKRKYASIWIKENALTWGIGIVDVAIINEIGIGKAAQEAFRRAIREANMKFSKNIDYLLVDAFYIPNVEGLGNDLQTPLIKGDTKSISIAAASIIAKVHRDTLMEELGSNEKYLPYDWMSNKGYGTVKHLKAIKECGICELHRTQFVETWKRNQRGDD
jgi:ribonuclease HII